MIASGLRPSMNVNNLDGHLDLVPCNYKERKHTGFPSHRGMVLCASNKDRTVMKVVGVPVEAMFGERLTVSGVDHG